MHRLLLIVVSLAFSFLVPIANSHHGFSSHFEPDRVIRIEGTVKQFDFINPHGHLYIESVNDAGEPVVYVCDLQARTQLVRRGVDDTLFTVGDPIVVEAFPAKRDPYKCEFGVAHFADGSTFTMRSTDKARTKFAEIPEVPTVNNAYRSIFGNWIRPGMDGYTGGRGKRTGDDSITAEGKAAQDAYDPITENPVLRCVGTSPIQSWGPPGLATSIRQVNSEIYIHHESMDVTRTVHMNLTEHPAGIQASDMGHSIGRFEGNTLIIDTAEFTNGVIVGTTLHTDQMILEERVSVMKDTGELLINWMVNDPVYYLEPLTGSQRLQSTNQAIIPYDCVLGEPGHSY
jgi:hypothetical protein